MISSAIDRITGEGISENVGRGYGLYKVTSVDRSRGTEC